MLKYLGISLLFVATSTTLGSSVPTKFDELDENRIVGGHQVDIFKYPYQVALKHKRSDTTDYSHFCGGSIYKDNVIITAAHCVTSRSIKYLIVVGGTNNREGGDGYVARISKIIEHEHFEMLYTEYDIALLILATPLPLNNYTIAAIPLPTEPPKDGAKAVVTGWGTTASQGEPSETLLAAEVPIVDSDRCELAYGSRGFIRDSMLCAGVEGIGGKDSCQGDSGGPLVVNGKLTGIVSWGRGCALPDYPGVYTNVYMFLRWIKRKVAENA